MAVINVTPDSFSDGGMFGNVDTALRRAEEALEEGADILDIGGESTRPGAERVRADEEIRRVCPVISGISKRFDAAVSIDTSKSVVAGAAVGEGAEIINDISGLAFDDQMASTAAGTGAGVVLMHLKGSFQEMHRKDGSAEIVELVVSGLEKSVEAAVGAGIARERICVDVGIGFGKTVAQNLELIGNLDKIKARFADHALLIGTSRKSFIGELLNEGSPRKRVNGTLAANAVAVWQGANIIRVHDVRENAEMLRIVTGIMDNA